MRPLLLAGSLLLACSSPSPPPPPEAPAGGPTPATTVATGTELGRHAPDITLKTSAGGEFALRKRERGPLVVVFFRGVW